MFEVKIFDTNGGWWSQNFSTHAEASRFVRAARAKRFVVELVTKQETIPAGKLGGYGRASALKPIHCARV